MSVVAAFTDSVVTSEVAAIFDVVDIWEGRCEVEYIIHSGYPLVVVQVQMDLKMNHLLAQ